MNEKKCCVPSCNRTRADETVLHIFPNPEKDMSRFRTWINAIGGDITSMDPHNVFSKRRICHYHFESRFHTWSKRLSPNAVPTLGLAGFTILSSRRPMQDVTNSNTNEIERMDTSQGSSTFVQAATTIETTQGHIMQDTSQPSTSVQVAPIVKKGTYTKLSTKRYQWEMIALGNKIRKLQKAKESTMNKLKKAMKLSENPTFQKALKEFTTAATTFTMLQFRETGKKKKGLRFKKDEKIMALVMYKQGPRAYRWLRKFFVLPSPLTLTRMINSASLKPGINENLFQQLEKLIKKMNTREKLCILLFDEIALSPHFDFNRRTDTITGFVSTGLSTRAQIADHALVFMIKGVHKNYKQPLAYSFCSMTTPKQDLVVQIKNIIRKLHQIGFKVLATVCDQGATNVSAINWLIEETRGEYLRLNKDLKHRVFEIDGKEVIPLYDPPHLIKGIRNNLLTKDLKCMIDGEEKIAKWNHIIQLYNENPAYRGIRLIPKLTERHVIPQKICKMKVKLATQVFSQTVGAQMGYLASNGILPKECEDTAEILVFFDNLFDTFNGSFNKSRTKTGKMLLQAVTPNSNHHQVWSKAKNILKSMKFLTKGKLSVVPSITNWLQTIENTEYMVKQLFDKYSWTSLWMRHFNQDPLENFFGCIRSHGYRNNSPSCAGFEAAFASLLINNLSSVHSPGANCEMDSCKVFKSLNKLFFQKPVMSNCTLEVDFDDINDSICIVYLMVFVDVDEKIKNAKIKILLEYISGYVLRKLKNNVLKNCKDCKSSFYNEKIEESSIGFKEYFKNKKLLTYPNMNLIRCFSNIQDIVINILRKDSKKMYIKQYVRTVCSIIVDYGFIDCEQHKTNNINEIENICLNLFIFNWCKDINKLLNGSRSDYDCNDIIQKLSVEYYKKRRK